MLVSTEVPSGARRVLADTPERLRLRLRSRHLDAEIASWVIALSGEPAGPRRCRRAHAGAGVSELPGSA